MLLSMRLPLLAASLVLAALVCGCAPNPKTPDSALLGMGEFSLRGSRADATLTLRLSNPNAYAVTVNGLRASLTLNGLPYASATSSLSQAIPAYGTADIDLPATVGEIPGTRGPAGAVRWKTVNYELEAKIDFTGLENVRKNRSLSDKGVIDASRLLAN